MAMKAKNAKQAGAAAGAGAATGAAAMARVTQRFPVEGLDCGECGSTIRTGLRQLAGVQAINVNVAAQEIAVTFDPNRVQPDAIKVQLEQLGVGCS